MAVSPPSHPGSFPRDPSHCLLSSLPQLGSERICQLATSPNDSSSNCPLINYPNLVGASLIASDDSLCGWNSSKQDALGIPRGTNISPWKGIGGLYKGQHHQDNLKIAQKNHFILSYLFL
ncbi:hypothetical protein O181_025893 [Austropuccinia psidii MF-1]|uniref:Uncharacterized protein n=1 Tax=Austropuccinia psidii MF-1 TaxID=1389203 RepID=A0A9Q3CNS0_9BASI|nr:hypothetical protein [Austropuccinia psidii MF-1]